MNKALFGPVAVLSRLRDTVETIAESNRLP